jgi:hypothetical protein
MLLNNNNLTSSIAFMVSIKFFPLFWTSCKHSLNNFLSFLFFSFLWNVSRMTPSWPFQVSHLLRALRIFIEWNSRFDELPNFLLDPSWAQVSQTAKLFGTRGTLPALNIKRGRGACWSFGMGLGRGTSFSYLLEPTSKKLTSWLVHILEHPWC